MLLNATKSAIVVQWPSMLICAHVRIPRALGKKEPKHRRSCGTDGHLELNVPFFTHSDVMGSVNDNALKTNIKVLQSFTRNEHPLVP